MRHVAQPLLCLASLPYEAYVSLSAFAVSGLRLPFTRRGLMIWHLPRYARLNARCTLGGFLVEMWPAPLVALVAAAAIAFARPASLVHAAPLLALWFAAPFGAWRISRPRRRREPDVSETQRRELRTLACRTWRFFDTFTGEADNWLPPDNYQEDPDPVVAARTSPTKLRVCRAALTPRLASRGRSYRAAKLSGSHWPAPFFPVGASCCWMSRPRMWTWIPSSRFSGRSRNLGMSGRS